MNLIQAHITQINALCASHEVDKLYAFGSVLTPYFDANGRSDIDFYISMNKHLEPVVKGEQILDLWLNFEKLFERKIDLITDTSIKNPYFQKEIDATKTIIYERKS